MTTTNAAPGFCTSCGNPRREGTGFCTRCGSAFATLPAPREALSAPTGATRPPLEAPPSFPSGPSPRLGLLPTQHPQPVVPPPQQPPPTLMAPASGYRPVLPTPPVATPPWSAAPSLAPGAPWFARPVTAAVAVLVALLAVGGGAYVLLRAPSTTSVAAPTTVSPVEDEVRPSAVAGETPTASADPHSQLQSLANTDSAAVEGLVGSWVPQLSSKRPGLVADGETWDDAAILAEHQALRSAHSDARVLWTGDFANYRGRNFWATVVGEPVPTAAAANAWCDAQGLDADHCYAVRLTHAGGPEGNAVMRPHR